MIAHIFNPEHDIALAADNIFWTAPHAGRQLRADLGWIPAIWAKSGDIIIVDDVPASQNSFRKFKHEEKDITFTTIKEVHRIKGITQIMPWGWDKSIVHQLVRNGIDCSLLPSERDLSFYRNLSDRATSAELLQSLNDNFTNTCGKSFLAVSIDEIDKKLTKYGKIVIKSPWSSSGRGVRYLEAGCNNRSHTQWAEKVIRTQGHIMIEPYLNKVMDFGMEFLCHSDGLVTYEGLSLFSTSNGAYEGSILATEDEKSSIISKYINASLLSDVQQYICNWMQKKINKRYIGPFGVDMMIVQPNLINPCVEINLRRTMGHVALAISPKQNDLQQIMRVSYEGANYHFRITNDHEIMV